MRHLPFLLAVCLLLSRGAFARGDEAAGPDAASEAAIADLSAERVLYVAKTRGVLIAAGYGSPEEFSSVEVRAFGFAQRDPRADDTQGLADRLWRFRAFPGVREALLKGLLQENLSLEGRLARFAGESDLLLRALETLRRGRDEPPPDDRAAEEDVLYWCAGREVPPAASSAFSPSCSSEVDAAAVAAQRDVAGLFLPLLLEALEEDAPASHLAALEARGLMPYSPWKETPLWMPGTDAYDYGRKVPEVALALLEARPAAGIDDGLRERAAAFFRSGAGTPAMRLAALPFLFKGASPEEAVRYAVLSAWAEQWGGCWGEARFSYGITSDCDEDRAGSLHLEDWVKALPRLSVDGGEGARPRIRELDAAPRWEKGPYYLLLESVFRLPGELRRSAEAGVSVFEGTALGPLRGGPWLLPVDPGSESGAALLRWFAGRERAENRDAAVLLESPAPERELRRRMASWHLGLWKEGDGSENVVFNRPCSDSFLRAVLPQAAGRAAALFVAPGERLFFRRVGLRGGRWQEVSLVGAPPAGPLELSSLVFPPRQAAINGKRFDEDMILRETLDLRLTRPRPGTTPEADLALASEAGKAFFPLAERRGWSLSVRRAALKWFWELSGTPCEKEGRDVLLDPGETPFEAREQAVRVLLKQGGGTPCGQR